MNSRQIFAALANPATRAMYAHVVLAQAPTSPTAKEAKSLRTLERAGLVQRADGTPTPTDVFRELLATHPSEPPRGHERFLENGRITRWPSRFADKDGMVDGPSRQIPKMSVP